MPKTVDELTTELRDYARLFYTGGGPTDDEEYEFNCLISDLIDAVRQESINEAQPVGATDSLQPSQAQASASR